MRNVEFGMRNGIKAGASFCSAFRIPHSEFRNPQMNLERYSRQILFPGIGKEGQQLLAQSQVVIIGCGALGAMHAEWLARAGVGRLRLIDRDFIEESNLHRQIMFEESDVADRLPKAVAAAARVNRINSEVEAEAVVKDVNYSNVEEL